MAWEILSGGSQTEAGELVTPLNSMQQATIHACVNLLSTSIASMPLVLFEKLGAGKIEAKGNGLYRLLKLEPNPECTAMTLWSAFMSSVMLFGNGYIELQTNPATKDILGLWFLPPTSVTPTRQADGSLIYRVTQGMTNGKFRTLTPKQIIHVPSHYSIDGVTGVSMISTARLTVGSMVAMDKYGARFFSNNAVPSGILSTKMRVKPEDKTRMRTEWENIHAGAGQHRTAVLDQETSYESISSPNSDAEWVASRRLSREEICGIFGVKTSQISDTSRVAGETYAAQQLDWLTSTLNPWIQKLVQELTRKLLVGLDQYEIQADTSDRLKLDMKSQLDAFAVARQWGIMNARECRTALGLDPGPEESIQFWMPVNMIDPAQPRAANKPNEQAGQNG